MSDFAFDPGPAFLAFGDALQWPSTLMGIHLTADALIAASCVGLSLALIRSARREPQLPAGVAAIGRFLTVLFLSLGLTHATQVVTMSVFEHGVLALAKSASAVLAFAALVVLVRRTAQPPEARPASPPAPNIADVDKLVSTRTAELSAANEQLRRESAQHEESVIELRRINTALLTQVGELQSLFKALPVGVAISTDTTCRSIRANEAYSQLMGLSHARSSSLSAPPFEAPSQLRISHDGRELGVSELPMQRAVAENTAIQDFEQQITRPDGVTLDVITNAVPIRNAAGEPCGCVATFQDFSAHKQAERKRLDFERRLLQSQKLESIGVLAGGIAHDFNNLLTGVLGHANFARGELARGSTNIDHLLAQVETSAQRAADLCRQLLAYAGKGRIVVRLIDINVAIQQSAPLLKLAISRKIELDLQLAAGLPPLRGDPSQINQVLLNLVTNASEAIGQAAGTVTIRTDRVNLTPMDMLTLTASPEMEPGSYICIEVRDTGGGISPEAIGHIFEPFFTTKFVGRGLGLSAVIGIVQGHRGGIRVSSQMGVGTTFELFFPIVTPAMRASASPFPGAPATNRGMVLVVDDDPTVREFAAAILTGASYTVVTAVDGEDALAKVRRDNMQFDAVLLDLTMPKLDGEDTLIALRMISPQIPVVLTSGYGEQEVVQRFVGRGLADFLPKPFLSEALLGAISTAIDRARAATL